MNTNKQQAAIALLVQLVVAGPKRRAELLKQQFSFVAVTHNQERIVSHGEFFAEGHPPLRGVVQTYAGLAIEDVEGGAAFVPFFPFAPSAPPAPVAAAAPVAPAATPAPAPAPKIVSTLSRRVAFGETIEIRDGLFQLVEIFETPSSGAVVQELFSDGSQTITFVGLVQKTWTI